MFRINEWGIKMNKNIEDKIINSIQYFGLNIFPILVLIISSCVLLIILIEIIQKPTIWTLINNYWAIISCVGLTMFSLKIKEFNR